MTTDCTIGKADYPALFQQYVLRSITLAHAILEDAATYFSDEARDRALHLLNFAMTQENAWPATRDLLLLLAPKMEQAGHRDDWLPYLERGVALSQQQNDRQAAAELALAVGELLRLRSKFVLARQRLETSIATFAALGAKPRQARSLNELAFVAWQQHQYDESEMLAQSALTLLEENDPERATCFSRLGLVAIDRQQWAEAERYHRQAIQIRQAQGDQRKFAWSLQNLGYALRGQKKYTEAINCYEQAMAILEDIRDIGNCANVQVNLGIVYWLIGQPTYALKMYVSAERVYRYLYDTHNLANTLNNIGLAYLNLEDWVRSAHNFTACIALYKEIGDTSLYLDSLDGLGLVYLNEGQYDKAIATFEIVLAELPKIESTPTYNYLSGLVPTHLAQAKEKERNAQVSLCYSHS